LLDHNSVLPLEETGWPRLRSKGFRKQLERVI